MANFRARGDGMPQIADKAREDNQCIVRGQLIAGPNILIQKFDAAGLHNIEISALMPNFEGGGATGVIPRMFHCLVDVLTIPNADSFASTRLSREDGGIFFGTAKYIDIVHNWGLVGRIDEYICTTKDLTRYITGNGSPTHYPSIQSYPKNHAIDKDTIRLHFTDIGSDVLHNYDDELTLGTSQWRANDNTKVGDPDHYLPYGNHDNASLLIGFPRYFVTIMEKV